MLSWAPPGQHGRLTYGINVDALVDAHQPVSQHLLKRLVIAALLCKKSSCFVPLCQVAETALGKAAERQASILLAHVAKSYAASLPLC